jgi:hypothetical protein
VSGSKQIIVSREYKNSPDECTRAIELLLKESVSKAARPAPEPGGCDGTKSKEDSANVILPD